MDTIVDIPGARRALRQYLVHADGKLTPETFSKLEDLNDSPSPVDQIVGATELLYARQDELDDTGKELVGALASFAATNGWHGMADDNRGGLIAQAMTRELGVKTAPGQAKPQKPDEDPAPREQYVAPPPADEELPPENMGADA